MTGKPSKGVDIVRDIASAEDLDAIYMHSDCVYTPGTLATLDELGKLVPRDEDGHIFLAGVDACLQALDAIRAGFSDQASNQPIPDFGVVAADFIEKELAGEIDRGRRGRRAGRRPLVAGPHRG